MIKSAELQFANSADFFSGCKNSVGSYYSDCFGYSDCSGSADYSACSADFCSDCYS